MNYKQKIQSINLEQMRQQDLVQKIFNDYDKNLDILSESTKLDKLKKSTLCKKKKIMKQLKEKGEKRVIFCTENNQVHDFVNQDPEDTVEKRREWYAIVKEKGKKQILKDNLLGYQNDLL